MLDIMKIRQNPDAIKAGMKAKEVDCDAIVDRILELDVQVRALKTSTEGKTAEGDYKTRLQEVVQQNPEEHLHYELEEESGPDHDKHFVVAVYLNSNCIGRGHGHSKKMAEQHAAREALALMGLKDLQPQTPATEAKQK